MKEIAKQWYDLGANVVVLNANKEPLVKWDQWQNTRQTEKEFESLPWQQAEAYAIIMGAKLTNGLFIAGIDIDTKKVSNEAILHGKELEKHLRVTATEKTLNNGKHVIYYSRTPVKSVNTPKIHDFCGCEVLGENRLCIMSPSKGYAKLNDNTPTEVESVNVMFEDALRRIGFKTEVFNPNLAGAKPLNYKDPHALNIRPCILVLLQKPHMEHSERLAIVTEYLAANVKPGDIELLFKSQDDYNPEKTHYQVENIEKNGYKKFLCSTLEDMNICIPSCPQVKVRKALELEPSEPWSGDPDELMKEADHHDILEAYESTIKHDETCVILTFLSTLLNYTKEEQQNIIFKSQTASGKTHIALEVTNLFPKEDVKTYYNVSPKAFWHEYGIMNPETHTIMVDLEKTILVFLDQKNSDLLTEMRALLSHDKKIIETKITDRSKRGGHATKTVQIIGFPTFIFCSATAFLYDEDLNRAFLLSPSTDKNKLKETMVLITERKSDPIAYDKLLREDKKRQWLKARIEAIKNANILHIIIPEDLRIKLYNDFITQRPALAPRHQRDLPRLIALVKAFSLFNFSNRTHQQTTEGTNIIATEPDLLNAERWYKTISESNELGIPPEIYDLWINTIQPCIKENQGIATKEDIHKKYFTQHSRLLTEYRLKDAFKTLQAASLLFEIQHPTDKRQKVVCETTGPTQTKLGEMN